MFQFEGRSLPKQTCDHFKIVTCGLYVICPCPGPLIYYMNWTTELHWNRKITLLAVMLGFIEHITFCTETKHLLNTYLLNPRYALQRAINLSFLEQGSMM